MKYLGNKNRLKPFLKNILETIDTSKNKKALDLFAGTGNVSELLSHIGFDVDSVDYLKISMLSTFIKTNTTPIISKEILNSISNYKLDGFITNHYSDKVGVNIFKEEIANYIDGSLYLLNNLKNEIPIDSHYFILSSIIESADFRSNIMGSYQSFYKRGWRNQALKEWSIDIVKNISNTKNNFYNLNIDDFFLTNKNQYGLVYADPPYNNRNYSDVFHVLETIATNYNGKTKGLVNRPINGVKPSNFCNKKNVKCAFDNLFYNVSSITDIFLLSYSSDGIIDIDDIINISSKYFLKYEINIVNYRKFNTNKKNQKNNKVNEYIIKFKK